jgi:hypothetical protein
MRDGIQTKFKHAALRKSGCYFFSLLRIAECIMFKDQGLKHNFTGFTDDQIIALFKQCVEVGWVEEDCFIVNPVKVLNLALNEDMFTSVRKSATAPDGGYYITYVKKSSDSYHFLICGVGGFIDWDPWEECNYKTGNYPIDSYRVFN